MRATDLEEAAGPWDVPRILRTAAEMYDETVVELASAHQLSSRDPIVHVWAKIARVLERAALQIEKIPEARK
jgi:hypothetical protein